MSDEIKILLAYLDIAPNRLKVFGAFKDQEVLKPKEIAIKTGIKLNGINEEIK